MKSILLMFLVRIWVCFANNINPEILEAVFGRPSNGSYPAAAFAQAPAIGVAYDQAQAITPNNSIQVQDYLDSLNKYAPSQANYDKFDWTLTKRVASSSDENFLISPLGLKLALAILTEGSSGSTQSELVSVLGFDQDKKVVRDKFSKIVKSLQTESSQYILNLGSKIYTGVHVEPRQQFAAIAQNFYKTELTDLDFSNPAAAANAINQWVSNITEGRINNLVDTDDVTGVSALILNTLFFKGTWAHQFLPNETRPDLFFVTPTQKKETSFMNVKDRFYFTDSSKFNAKILKMPYVGNKFAMYIVVPNSLTGLSKIFVDLNDVRTELVYLQERLVDVTLPKFQFEYTSVLDGVLRELGIRQAFEDTASFPGIARGQALSQRLKISRVLQRSGIEVNELGSVAYSATEVSLVNKFGGSSEQESEIIANKPFMFFIQDEETQQLLFTGRVSDPTLPDGAFKLT